MAAQTPPYAQQNGSHTAALFRQAFASTFGVAQPGTLGSSAGGVTNATDLAVTAQASPNMTVNVAGGTCWIPQTLAANGGLYFGLNDATVVVAIAAANATNPRVDLICATVNDAAYSGSTNNWVIQAITGTPTAGATLANLNGAGALPSSSIPLGYVLVPAAATTVTSANISDVRTFTTTSNSMRGNPAGRLYASATTSMTGGTPTTIALAGTSYTKGGMTKSGNNLVAPITGYYQVNGAINILGTAGFQMAVLINVNGVAVAQGQSIYAAGYTITGISDVAYVVAGQAISLLGNPASTTNALTGSAYTFLSAALVSQ